MLLGHLTQDKESMTHRFMTSNFTDEWEGKQTVINSSVWDNQPLSCKLPCPNLLLNCPLTSSIPLSLSPQSYTSDKTLTLDKSCAHACSVVQFCPALWNPMDCSPPRSSVHEISQARIPEWVAISSSRGSSQHRDQTHIAGEFFTSWATREAQEYWSG